MKLHKLISKTVVATALLGATFGGAFSLNASAGSNDSTGGSTAPIGMPSSEGSPATPNNKSNFVVNNGLLTLDSVPNLSFGNSNGDSNILKLNNSDSKDNSTLLEVTDYRNNNNQNNNWQLTANMGPVYQITNSNTNNGQNQQTVNSQWELDLFNTTNDTAKNLDNGNKPNIKNTRLLSNNNGSVSDSNNTIMNRDTSDAQSAQSGGYGVNQIRYNSENNAQLITPNVAPATYQTQINWNLGTNVSSKNNLGNSDDNLNHTNNP